jgi:hypothetical protein
MAPVKGDLTASMVVLGLLIQRPDTPARMRNRLDEEVPHGRWSRATAYNNVRSLARQGYIRKVKAGRQSSEDLWEPTQTGVAAFMEYLRDAANAPPALRDAMLLWLEHSEESELPALLAVVQQLEVTAKAEFTAATRHLTAERERGNLGPADGSDWRGRVREMVLSDMALMWGQKALRFKKLGEKLTGEGRELHAEERGGG